MPRVHTATRRRAIVKHPMRCRACGNEIEVGQEYYSWEKRYGGKQFRHTTCGRPRPTELSDRKTAQIEEAIEDLDLSAASVEIGDWDGQVVSDLDSDCESFVEELRSMLEQVADTAREVGEEYESGADNMPESLQYGSQAEAMREVAQELESWADEVADFDPSESTPDWPEREETPDGEESDEDFRARVEDVLQTWADNVRTEAEDKLGDMPEYQG